MNKKYILDLSIVENLAINSHYVLLKTTPSDDSQPFPAIKSGQFAELKVENSPATFLRRPISIHFVDVEKKEIWFLIRLVGEGTRKLALLKQNETLNAVLPLGNGFTMPEGSDVSPVLIGGGVGIAPLLNLGKDLKEHGVKPTFLLGARSKEDLLQLDFFARYGDVHVTTEDGSLGEKGFVTQHSILNKVRFDRVYCCGPTPMMISVAKYARANHIACEVSLENKMACGVGACLCCVENTHEGHLCVCKDGPVFKIEQLLWQI